MLMGLTFKKKILNCIVELLKVFLHLPPPLGRECIIKVVEFMIPKLNTLSIPKTRF